MAIPRRIAAGVHPTIGRFVYRSRSKRLLQIWSLPYLFSQAFSASAFPARGAIIPLMAVVMLLVLGALVSLRKPVQVELIEETSDRDA